jgi:outer membrane murein-binding lipoprotein Lpp
MTDYIRRGCCVAAPFCNCSLQQMAALNEEVTRLRAEVDRLELDNATISSRGVALFEENAQLRRALDEAAKLIEVRLSTGRVYLDVAGFVTAIQGQACRDPNLECTTRSRHAKFPESLWDTPELEQVRDGFRAKLRALADLDKTAVAVAPHQVA